MTIKKCQAQTEVYSRVVGYFRPVQQWNVGKQLEFQSRKPYNLTSSAEKARRSAVKAQS